MRVLVTDKKHSPGTHKNGVSFMRQGPATSFIQTLASTGNGNPKGAKRVRYFITYAIACGSSPTSWSMMDWIRISSISQTKLFCGPVHRRSSLLKIGLSSDWGKVYAERRGTTAALGQKGWRS